MKIFLALVVLALLVFGFLIITSGKFKPNFASSSTNRSELQEPSGADCGKGVNGNNGDNFCANYHGGGSKCLGGGLPDTYMDGCTKI